MTECAKAYSSQAYLLRIWQERSESPTVVAYRCSLINPHTHERHSFESLALMASFLEDWLRQQEQPYQHKQQ